jgi:hypothetical protein
MTLFYIGDPAYVLGDEYYDALDLHDEDPFAPFYTLPDKRQIKFSSTQFGDAGATDKEGYGYSVDSGLLGIFKASDIAKDRKETVQRVAKMKGCRFVELPANSVQEVIEQGLSPVEFPTPQEGDEVEVITTEWD